MKSSHVGTSDTARTASLSPALTLLAAQRRVTYAFRDRAKAQRLRDEGVLASHDYERRVRAHTEAEAELSAVLRWLSATA